MKNDAFSLMNDESNDTALEKMNPINVRILDTNHVKTYFLDVCYD